MDIIIYACLYLIVGLIVTAMRWDQAYLRSGRMRPDLPLDERVMLLRIAGLLMALTWPVLLLRPFFKRKG